MAWFEYFGSLNFYQEKKYILTLFLLVYISAKPGNFMLKRPMGNGTTHNC
jgi:hypothetical protein